MREAVSVKVIELLKVTGGFTLNPELNLNAVNELELMIQSGANQVLSAWAERVYIIE